MKLMITIDTSDIKTIEMEAATITDALIDIDAHNTIPDNSQVIINEVRNIGGRTYQFEVGRYYT